MTILSHVKERLIEAAGEIDHKTAADNAIYTHSILCQTYFPYQDPKAEVWQHKNGYAKMFIQALKEDLPDDTYKSYGIPFGARGRLILTTLNDTAVKNQSPEIDVKKTFTEFVKSIGLANTGRNLESVKDHLKRINFCNITISYTAPKIQIKESFKLIRKFKFEEHPNGKWSQSIQLDQGYFNSLITRAVPMDMRALQALSHNAMSMDIYAWFCQRLHRIKEPVTLSWENLKEQFGQNTKEMKHFKPEFRTSLLAVKAIYPAAKIYEDPNIGIQLHNSPTAIPKQLYITFK